MRVNELLNSKVSYIYLRKRLMLSFLCIHGVFLFCYVWSEPIWIFRLICCPLIKVIHIS